MVKSVIMTAVLVTTCANMMAVRASRSISIRCNLRHNSLLYIYGAHSMPIPNVRSLSDCLAFMPSSFAFTQRRSEQRPAMIPLRSAIPSSRCCKIHSSSTLMAKRKKNGGKGKKAQLLKSARRSSQEVEEDLTVDEDLNGILEDKGQESPPIFTARFASEYHAPVMPSECIDALLQQGEWGEMLIDRKERWRKKRSIIEAKRRRTGYYDDKQEGYDVESVEHDDGEEQAELSLSHVASASSDTNSQPRLFIDGTLGGGGHSMALLQQLSPGDILIGCDVDPEALATASTRLVKYLATCEYILEKNGTEKCEWEKERPMFIPVQSNFRNLRNVLSKVRHPVSRILLLGSRENTTDQIGTNHSAGDQVEFPSGVNGMLLDLGVSSHQIDTSERGFAFMKEGPLDMRMSGDSQAGSLTAADICNEFDEATLIDILRNYGDEPRAKRVASAIVSSRPIHTTTALVQAINTVTPTFARQKRAGLIATSARVFQALRIVVNEEDGALKEVLEGVAPWALAQSQSHYLSQMQSECGDMNDGILAVLSYHSMEDKMAKRVIRDGKVDLLEKSTRRRGGALERDIYGNIINNDKDCNVPFESLSKPRKATDEEVAVNSRSRSATLRVAIRI
mmetsp:Transcript_15991/g.38428  ORF Transcript_15991/g.38428 Transcript_15991/m.38428 type:complete len:622 (+) Transcript_15991:204-2069(+)